MTDERREAAITAAAKARHELVRRDCPDVSEWDLITDLWRTEQREAARGPVEAAIAAYDEALKEERGDRIVLWTCSRCDRLVRLRDGDERPTCIGEPSTPVVGSSQHAPRPMVAVPFTRAAFGEEQASGAALAELEKADDIRIAAAILVGSLVEDDSNGLLDLACVEGRQPPQITAATRQIVADVRRHEEGTAAGLAEELAARRAALGGEAKRFREAGREALVVLAALKMGDVRERHAPELWDALLRAHDLLLTALFEHPEPQGYRLPEDTTARAVLEDDAQTLAGEHPETGERNRLVARKTDDGIQVTFEDKSSPETGEGETPDDPRDDPRMAAITPSLPPQPFELHQESPGPPTEPLQDDGERPETWMVDYEHGEGEPQHAVRKSDYDALKGGPASYEGVVTQMLREVQQERDELRLRARKAKEALGQDGGEREPWTGKRLFDTMLHEAERARNPFGRLSISGKRQWDALAERIEREIARHPHQDVERDDRVQIYNLAGEYPDLPSRLLAWPDFCTQVDRANAAEAELERLREALQFVSDAEVHPDASFGKDPAFVRWVGDLKSAARAALASSPGEVRER